MATEKHSISVGDTLTPLAVQLKQKDVNGAIAAVSLVGATVKFTLVNSVGTVIANEVTTGVSVTDQATGKVQYDFQAADVVAAGTFYGWFTVYSGTEKDTYPAGGRKLVIEISARA
jgi:hypothetical protein